MKISRRCRPDRSDGLAVAYAVRDSPRKDADELEALKSHVLALDKSGAQTRRARAQLWRPMPPKTNWLLAGAHPLRAPVPFLGE